MTARQYPTPLAFKQALEQRLRSSSASGTDFSRRRQLLVFDRFLARLERIAGDAVILKGGLVLEMRLARARTTKDVDLRMTGPPSAVLDLLQEAGRLDLGDFLRFEVQADDDHPEIRNVGMRYEGFRFRSVCRLAGHLYGQPFGVDVAFGDPLTDEPDLVTAADWLAFAGIPPPTVRLYPVVSHIAEKLHAFTLPRPLPNTRVRDLPDLALLATTGPLDAEHLRRAIHRTFKFRNTHPVPLSLPPPPAFWEAPYAKMAATDALPWATLSEVTEATVAFLDPVLGKSAASAWEPSGWRWK